MCTQTNLLLNQMECKVDYLRKDLTTTNSYTCIEWATTRNQLARLSKVECSEGQQMMLKEEDHDVNPLLNVFDVISNLG